MTDEERFWSKVDVRGPDECWPWTAAVTSAGYGVLNVRGKLFTAHRMAWTLVHGPIPVGPGFHGTCVRHDCDNRICCNVKHLRLGTQSDNVHDMWDRDRAYIPNLRGEATGYAKLTAKQVNEIRSLSGMTQSEIAKRYGISQPTVSAIRLGQRWAHLLALGDREDVVNPIVEGLREVEGVTC